MKAPEIDKPGAVASAVFTADERAAMLGLSIGSIYVGAANGEIPHRRVGRRFLFPKEMVMKWLTTNDGKSEHSTRALHERSFLQFPVGRRSRSLIRGRGDGYQVDEAKAELVQSQYRG